MKKVLKRPNGTDFVAITYVPEEKWVYVDWNGYLDVDMVKEGSEELLKVIKANKVTKTLISNKKVSGPWNKANDWYANDWNPRAAKEGLKYMAVIVSDNIFTQLSLAGFEKVNNGSYTVHTFNDDTAAANWLRKQN